MRLVHLADLHLGFRQYQRLTPGGINQREADIARSFEDVVGRVITIAPDLVVIAGDVFHSVRPTNASILHAFIQFSRLKHALPDAAIVIIAGNHDTPRSAETGGILQLFSRIGFSVVDRGTERLNFRHLDLSVLAVPDAAAHNLPAFIPERDFSHNVLLLHGSIRGMLPASAEARDHAAIEVGLEDINPSRWSYVALGHYHVYRQIADNAYYSGSIDYTNLNMWGEKYEQDVGDIGGKGFIEQDLVSGRHTFHTIPESRPLIDLPAIPARGLAPADVNERIRITVESCRGGIDSKIVRLKVNDLARHLARELDHKAIREYKRRALNFHLDLRPPVDLQRVASGAPGRRPSLADVVRENLNTRTIDADLDRAALVELGLRYLEDAEQVPMAAPMAAED